MNSKRVYARGIAVTDAIVLLDREQGGSENIQQQNVRLHSIIKTNSVLDILFKSNKIDQETYDKTNEFLNTNKKVSIPTIQSDNNQVLQITHFKSYFSKPLTV